MFLKKWANKLFAKAFSTPYVDEKSPTLLQARSFAKHDIGKFRWDLEHNSDLLTVTNSKLTIEWTPKHRDKNERIPVWIQASTDLHLHSGHFRWDFKVEEMTFRQIGVGFMLLWDHGPDWGFFGYLGASPTAWAYDPSTGDVVCATESIEGGLPKFDDMRSGIVSVELKIPRNTEGEGKFIINMVETQPIHLPSGAVIHPAACLLKEKQKITLENFQRF